MNGRIEHKICLEKKIQNKIMENAPAYMGRYYYSLNQNSHTTKQRYITNVIRFLMFYGNEEYISEEKLKEIDAFDIERYIESIQYIKKNDRVSELEGTTKATIYSSLNSFFTFLKRYRYIDENPFSDKRISRPRLKENDIVFLADDEVRNIENAIINGCGTDLAASRQAEWKDRDMALFFIPLTTGLRVCALSEINMEDIDLENNRIIVTEKGNITKYIYIPNVTKKYLQKWISKRDELLKEKGKECEALFISNRRTRMTVRSIEIIIQKYATVVNGKHITPHSLRRTFGTNAYQDSRDIYKVSKLLGHKDTSPTKRYVKVFDDDLAELVMNTASRYE